VIEGEPCRLSTADGATIRARDVVVATHYPVLDRAMLFARLVPHRELVVAAPIPAGQDPDGMYITPEHNTRSVRTTSYVDGQRLLIVTGESFTPGTVDVASRYARLTDWTRQHFSAEATYRWAPRTTTPPTGFLTRAYSTGAHGTAMSPRGTAAGA
jgi:hypothetical protein